MVVRVSRATCGNGSVLTSRVYLPQWVVASVGVLVQALGIADVRVLVERVGTHEPAHAGGIVRSPEVVEAGFGVAFFAGEFMS